MIAHLHRSTFARLRTFAVSSFAIGLASLVWLIIRSGPKPSRAAYPCQRMAAANAAAWLGVTAVPLLLRRTIVIWRSFAEHPRVLIYAVLASAAAISGGAALTGVVALAGTSETSVQSGGRDAIHPAPAHRPDRRAAHLFGHLRGERDGRDR